MPKHLDTKTPFLSPYAALFLKRLGLRFIGFLTLLINGMIAASFLTFNPSDPSFNTASGQEITNAMGFSGALISDIFMQYTGIASYIPLIVFSAWSLRLMSGSKINRPWLKSFCVFMAVVLMTASFAGFSATASWRHLQDQVELPECC